MLIRVIRVQVVAVQSLLQQCSNPVINKPVRWRGVEWNGMVEWGGMEWDDRVGWNGTGWWRTRFLDNSTILPIIIGFDSPRGLTGISPPPHTCSIISNY